MTKPTGNPRGRPPVTGTTRGNLVQVMLTDTERAALVAAATDMRATLADALRRLPELWSALSDRERKRLRG